MKLKNLIKVLNDEKVQFELTWKMKNQYDEPLQVANLQFENYFLNPEIFGSHQRKLLFESIPCDNGKSVVYAIYLETPINPQQEFELTLLAEASPEFFKKNIIQKNGVYYWEIYAEINQDDHYYQEIDFDLGYQVIDVKGVEPDLFEKHHLLWDIDAFESHVFHATVSFKTLNE